MHRFRVWALLPKKVDIQVDGVRHVMVAEPGGWWHAEISSAEHGSDYGLFLDDKGPTPDPRSPWQSSGVRGLSRLVDHDAFRWTDFGWQAPPLSSSVIYEMHVGTFTQQGTFEAAIEKLDHLVELGVTHVLTSPFVPLLFQGEEWGASTPFLFFSDHEEPELAQAVREGRHREFAVLGWEPAEIPDPQVLETFERSILKWSELSRGIHVDLLDWHRQLIQLRRDEPRLTDGRLDGIRARFEEPRHWLVVEHGEISVACNLGDGLQRIPLRDGKHRTLMVSESVAGAVNSEINLPPDSVAVLKSETT